MAKYLVEDFHLGAGQMGAILSVFQVGYVLIVVFTGWLHRTGPRKVVASATVCAALASTAFLFLARDFTSILILEARRGAILRRHLYAPGMAFLSSWFGPKERGKALGAYTAALTAAYAGGYWSQRRSPPPTVGARAC